MLKALVAVTSSGEIINPTFAAYPTLYKKKLNNKKKNSCHQGKTPNPKIKCKKILKPFIHTRRSFKKCCHFLMQQTFDGMSLKQNLFMLVNDVLEIKYILEIK